MPSAETFGVALRRLRLSAGLTQERLAELAAISANGIAALEAGRRQSPRLSTVRLLCDALQLNDDQRSALLSIVAPIAVVSRSGTTVTAATSVERSPFIGRIVERQKLQGAWDERVRIVLVSGEAGVGKTRLTEELARHVEAGGLHVLRGRCTPEQLGVYEPFVDPIRRALSGFDGVLPASLRELDRVIPGLVEAGHAAVPSRTEPGLDRRFLFEAVSSAFSRLGPTLLLLDDLQWADQGSLALLSFLAAQPELCDVVMLGTVRSTDVTPSTSSALAELRRRCSMVRINLNGLDAADVALLVEGVAGQTIPAGLVQAVTIATSGNPLYVGELTEHLLQRGFDAATTHHVSVPEGIRDTIGLRVTGLSREGQSLLRAGSVLGPAFDLVLAGRLAGLDGLDFVATVEDALLSGLLVERSVQTAAFSHGLVATTVYAAMSSVRRVELHRQAAQHLGALGAESSSAIVDIARHWGLVAEADPFMCSVAASWAVRAGDAAISAAAIDEAIACYERAAALWSDSTVEHADTLIRLGTALAASGRVGDADRHFHAALRLADGIENPVLFTRAALGLSAAVRYGSSDPERIAELESAITRLGSREMVLRPAALATLMRQLGFVMTPEADQRRNEAAALVLEAVSVSDVPVELVMSLGALRDSIPVDHPVPLGRLARQIIDVATARRDLPMISTGWYRQAWSAMELGEAQVWRQAVDEYRKIAIELRRPYEMALSANMLASVAQVEGRYEDAEAFGQEALSHATTINDGNFSAVYLANSVLRGLDTGLAQPMLELMTAVRNDYVGVPTFDAGLALTAASAGEIDFTQSLLDEQIGRWKHYQRRDAEWLPVLGFLAGACAISGDARHASPLRELLVERPARIVRIGPVGAWYGPVDHHIGALSRVLGDLDEAQRRLESALVIESEMNGPTFRIRTTLELARTLRDRGEADATTTADQLWDQASGLAEELSLHALIPSR